MSSVFTVGGTTFNLDANAALPIRYSERFGQIPTLTIQRRGVTLLPVGSDPLQGKLITWAYSGTTYFSGYVISVSPHFDERLGWILTYQCMGLRSLMDLMPHTDSNTGIDASAYNLTPDDPAYNPARAGRSVGQILADVLTMPGNAVPVNAYGIGGYTGMPTTPTLPAATVADLAAMTVIPPRPVYFTGEKLGGAIDGFLQQYAPNYRCWIRPSDGVFRFLDIRSFPATTLTMDVDPIEPTEISRDAGDCFQRCVGRGSPIARMALLKLSKGDITENFAHDGLTNSAAKTAWTPSQYRTPGTAQDIGTCTCPTTLTITVTSSNPATSWSAGYWDQSHNQGVINLSSTTITGYTQYWSARIVSCPALTAGGSCTLTIDASLPATGYDHYTITGLSTGGSVVWTQYQIANTALWPRVVAKATYPQPFAAPGGGGVAEVDSPSGLVLRADGATVPAPFTFNSATGNIRFFAPTWVTGNDQPPADVWVLLPVQGNPNVATWPADVGGVPQYDGTSNTVEGFANTLTITLDDWRDPAQGSQVLAYVQDQHDAGKDTVCEGAVVYYGMYLNALTFGMALNIAGNDGTGSYPTGWEALNLAVLGVDVEWPEGAGQQIRTTMHCSNRRAALTASMFMAPERRFLPIGGEGFDQLNQLGAMLHSQAGSALGNFLAGGGPDLGSMGPGSLGNLGPGDMSSLGGGDLSQLGPGDMRAMNPMAGFTPQWDGSLPTSMGDLGLPTSMGDLGLPTSPASYFGFDQGQGGTPPDQGPDDAAGASPVPNVEGPDFTPGGAAVGAAAAAIPTPEAVGADD